MPSRAYNSFLLAKPILIGSNYVNCVNALSGLYLISTMLANCFVAGYVLRCQCPLGLITHFYGKTIGGDGTRRDDVSMPSRAYISFLRLKKIEAFRTSNVPMPSRAYNSFLRVYPASLREKQTRCVNALSGL